MPSSTAQLAEAKASATGLLPFSLESPTGTYTLTSVLTMTSVAAIYLGHAVSDPSRTLVFKHQRTAKAVWTEMALQRALSSSPYTLPLLDRFTHPSGIFMVLPYCDQGDLFDEIIRVHADPSACSREDRAAWASSRLLTLLQAVAYMHGEGIFHRDLKPENILLYRSILLQSPSSAWGKAGGHPLISDFGIATRDPTASVRGFGSEFYMCPEALMDADSYRTCPLSTVPAAAADVWSLGVIALNLFTGRNPWAKADATTDAGYAAFLQDPWALMEMHGLSEAVGSLLIRMLCPDPRRRATISEALHLASSISSWIFEEDEEVVEEALAEGGMPELTVDEFSTDSELEILTSDHDDVFFRAQTYDEIVEEEMEPFPDMGTPFPEVEASSFPEIDPCTSPFSSSDEEEEEEEEQVMDPLDRPSSAWNSRRRVTITAKDDQSTAQTRTVLSNFSAGRRRAQSVLTPKDLPRRHRTPYALGMDGDDEEEEEEDAAFWGAGRGKETPGMEHSVLFPPVEMDEEFEEEEKKNEAVMRPTTRIAMREGSKRADHRSRFRSPTVSWDFRPVCV